MALSTSLLCRRDLKITHVIVKINGQAYIGWKDITLDTDFERVTSDVTISLAKPRDGNFPVAKGDELQVLFDGEPVLTGNVNSVGGKKSWKDRKIDIKGTDKTHDLVVSDIGTKNDFELPISMKQIAEKTIKNMGLKMSVIDEVGSPPFKEGENVGGDITKKGFDFLDGYSQKLQSFLRPDGKGNLKIAQGKGKGCSGFLLSVDGNLSNNVENSSYEHTEKGQSNSYNMSAQKSPNNKKFMESIGKGDARTAADEMANRFGNASNSAERPELRRFYRAVQASQDNNPKQTAQWHANIARARGFTYRCDVTGFRMIGGELWLPGFVVPVHDDYWEVEALLFIKKASFKKTWSGGEVVLLDLTYHDAYQPVSEPSKSAQRTAKYGMGHSQFGRFKVPSLKDLGIGK